MNNEFYNLLVNLNSVSVYKNFTQDRLVLLFVELFKQICFEVPDKKNFLNVLKIYSEICSIIWQHPKHNLTSYVFELVIYDENLISLNKFDDNILSAAKNDFATIMSIAYLQCEQIVESIKTTYKNFVQENQFFPKYGIEPNQSSNFDDILNFYKKNGFGIFAKYNSFVFDENFEISPVLNSDSVLMKNLKLYKTQKDTVWENTKFFIENKPYQNILLYGDRGCGKSSVVKAVANELSENGLRIIQIKKNNLQNLDILISKLALNPLKFIIFIDDLTFNENDDNFNMLKATLDGSLAKQPKNIVIYTTTNRCHLIKETFSSREGNEIHLSDTLDEVMSLPDRFGIIINYSCPSKENYLEIVRQLAEDMNLKIALDKLFKGAESWALEKTGRSPRIAAQYVEQLCSAEKF